MSKRFMSFMGQRIVPVQRLLLVVASVVGLVLCSPAPALASGNPVFDQEWALSTFKVQSIRNTFHAYGSGVVVAVIDSGVDPTQPDLQGQLLPGINLSDPAHPTSDTNDVTSDYHGTHVTAIIVAHGHGDPSNLQGVVGLASRAKALPIKDGNNTESAAAETAAIRYAADHGAKVINLSEGGEGPCNVDEMNTINYALSKNIVIVAAAGNNGNTSNLASCPADQPGVISVSAIQQDGTMDPLSHFGKDVTVAAPGVGIEVPAQNGQYTQVKGTSDAAPWVAAEAALIFGLHPNWTVGQVIRVIIDNTVTGGGKRVDDHVGYGVIDPLKALGAAAPNDLSNPLGGPLPPTASSSNAGKTSPKKSSSSSPYAGAAAVGVLFIIGIVVFLAMRSKKSNRSGAGAFNAATNQYPPAPNAQQPSPSAQQPSPPPDQTPHPPQ